MTVPRFVARFYNSFNYIVDFKGFNFLVKDLKILFFLFFFGSTPIKIFP